MLGKTNQTGEIMKTIMLIVALSLSACNGPPPTVPKIATPQREALEKAKNVEQVLQQANEVSQQKINEAEGK